jgi:hypothetical protein
MRLTRQKLAKREPPDGEMKSVSQREGAVRVLAHALRVLSASAHNTVFPSQRKLRWNSNSRGAQPVMRCCPTDPVVTAHAQKRVRLAQTVKQGLGFSG